MLKLRDIKKTYIVDKQHFPALKNINLSFPDKGFISILGPSGCGKTTLLNLIGGLDQYTSGDLIINNKSTKRFTDRDWDAYRNKRVGFVFQTYNLVPHLTVLGNVEISMTLTGMSKKLRQKKAIAALKRVGLKDTIKKKPNQLSGGQMQRVAIARSLVNNPEIILADEPTGALDSVTSVQVMEILKEVSKDRLVIMVTHNVELAKQYSTRIIRLKDGLVVGDSSPLKSTKQKETQELVQEKNKHTHMSFFTALGSSAKSLLTKKGRTIMTTVAASFGIIGVALVLAMSNGFQGYVNRVEAETASSVPITISPFVTTSIKMTDPPTPWPTEKEIKPYDEDLSKIMVVHRNRLTKEYADYAKGLLKSPTNYASSVLENHEYLDFNIFTERKTQTGGTEVIKVNQFQAAGAGGSILSGVTNLPSTIFHELYGGKEYINSLYDVIDGHYPADFGEDTNTAEVCVVCDRYNRIPMSTLYALGLSSSDSTQEGQKIAFNDIIGHEYKAYTPTNMLQAIKDNAPEAYKDKGYIEKPIEAGTYAELDYTTGPTAGMFIEGKGKTIKQYLNIGAEDAKTERVNIYNQPDSTYKPIKIKISGIIRPKRTTLVNLMPGSVCYGTPLKDYFVNLQGEYDDFSKAAKDNYYAEYAFCDTSTEEKAETAAELQLGLMFAYNYAIQAQNTNLLYNNYLNNPELFHFYNIFTDDWHQTEIKEPGEFDQQFSYSYLRSNYRFATEYSKTLDFYENTELLEDYTVLIPIPGTYDDLSDILAYSSGYSTITSVLIFPKSLSDKGRIFRYLDQYNKNLEEDQKILYSDLAGSLTDALGTMIDVISVVLIVFSSVSLLVSCVMTGVITYTSVLERTKEIGILRAIGARKKDVGRLFEAESVIIGGVAGLIGVLVTFIAEWPISLIINSNFPEQNIGMICNLSPIHALILVAISILLTFVSGFIPARKAANKDPVVALRTE